MKPLMISLILAISAFAQTTINLGAVTVPNEVRDAVETWRLGQNTTQATPITLVGNINAAVTSLTVSDASAISVGNQIVIDTEALNVTAKSSNVLTVTRGQTITVAASHASGAAVKVAKWPSSIALMREFVRNKVNEILLQQKPPSIIAAESAIAADQASKDAFLLTTVQ